MIYKRKASFLKMVVFMLCLCLSIFAQEAEKKPIQLPVQIANLCPSCPRGTQPNTIINIDFTGLTTSTYTIPGPNNPAMMTNPPSTFGTYAITNDPHACNGFWIQGTQGQGKILVCDGFGEKPTKLFGKAMSNLVPGREYIFCAKFKNLYYSGQSACDPRVQLRIAQNGNPIATSTELTLLKNSDWQFKFLQWTCPTNVTQATPEIWLTSMCNIGNDVGVDDISFVECKPRCDCDHWEPVGIKWIQPTGSSLGVSTATSPCGECIFNLGNVCLCEKISLTFNYKCKPVGCNPTYKWEITGPNTYHLNGSSPTGPCNISFTPTEPGLYSLTVAPRCGDTKCPPCQIKVFVKGIVLCGPFIDEPPGHDKY